MGAAESSLKPPLDLNLYEVLGVSKEASDDEIKVRMPITITPSLWFSPLIHD